MYSWNRKWLVGDTVSTYSQFLQQWDLKIWWQPGFQVCRQYPALILVQFSSMQFKLSGYYNWTNLTTTCRVNLIKCNHTRMVWGWWCFLIIIPTQFKLHWTELNWTRLGCGSRRCSLIPIFPNLYESQPQIKDNYVALSGTRYFFRRFFGKNCKVNSERR